MSFWNFARGPASVRLLLDFGQHRGLSAHELLAGSKISPSQLDDPNTELAATQELKVIENLLRLSRHPPGLGLEVGQCYRFSTFGLWGYGLVCSATLGEALSRALRFVQLTYAYSVIEPGIERGMQGPTEADTCWLRLRPPELATGLSRFLVERDLAAAATLLCELGGPRFSLRRIELPAGRGRAFRPSACLTALGGAPLTYGATGYGLAFDAAWLAHKLPSANPTSAAMCDEMCAQLLERRRVRAGTATLVRQVMASTPQDERLNISRLADLTSTSQRTLRRRLRGEGTSFRALLASAQSNEAAQLLGDRSLSISAIAERLGYADLSSFSQAFKRWHGVSPSLYRRHNS